MELKDIASISGKGGLYKVLKPTRTGVILEAIDETRSKFIAGASQRVSLLKEISIYTTSKEGSYPLEDLLDKLYEEYGDTLPVTSKTGNRDLYEFLSKFIPDYDQAKVYPSDIKKLISWYTILIKFAPEVLQKKSGDVEAVAETTEKAEETPVTRAEPKKKVVKKKVEEAALSEDKKTTSRKSTSK